MSVRKWTEQRVIDEIQKWHQQGTPASHIWRMDRNLCMAGFAVFGSWRSALAAAGLSSERQQWSAERVISELRAQHRQRATNPQKRLGKSRLDSAAARYFGSLHKALVAAGLKSADSPPRTLRQWTPAEVIEAIQLRASRGLALKGVLKDDCALHAAAKRIFGSWCKALEASGLYPPPTLTREEVVHAIQSRHRQGLALTGLSRTDPTLFSAARNCFGTWKKAISAAGLPTRQCRRWSKRAVIEAIRDRQQQGPPLSHVWRDDKPLFRAAVSHFGNWQSALRAAGMVFKKRQRWSRERVIEGLLQSYKGQSDFHAVAPTLVVAARRLYGNLEQALEAAGLEPPAGRWTKRRVVEQIQARYIQGAPIHFFGCKDKTLGYAAKRHFGSWHAAVTAAGLQSRVPPPAVTRSWTPEAVLAAIRERYQAGAADAHIWKQDTGLYSVAKKHFGTWRQAVSAAGLESAHRRWSRELVIEELLNRYERGLSFSSGVVFKEDCRLGGAALRYFKSWRAAIKATGLPDTYLQTQTKSPNQEQRAKACRAKT